MANLGLIQRSDTIEQGRVKTNTAINAVITGFEFPPIAGGNAGDILRLKTNIGNLDIPLKDYYVRPSDLLASGGIPYVGDWQGIDYSNLIMVSYNGGLYRNTSTAGASDVPGISSVWLPVAGVASSETTQVYSTTAYISARWNILEGATENETFYLPAPDALPNTCSIKNSTPGVTLTVMPNAGQNIVALGGVVSSIDLSYGEAVTIHADGLKYHIF